MSELPRGWIDATFAEIVNNLDGRRVPLKLEDRNKRHGEYPYYGASGVIDSIDQYLFDGPHLLIAEDGANLLSRSTPIAFQANGKFWVNNHAHVVQTKGSIPLGFVEYYFNNIDLAPYVTGTAQPKLTQGALNEITVPLPPLPEQRRIVSKIESLTTRSRRAKEALDAVPTLLEKFRQSVLAAAFRGDLTAEWRAKNPDVESAEVLLKRIRIERRKRWEEAELAKMRAKGKVPGDDRWKAKYEEPAPVDTSELPELPEGWGWIALDEIVIDSLYGPRFGAEDYSEDGVPTVRTTDIDNFGNIRWNNPPRITINAEQLDTLGLHDGDLVVTRTGATIGKCAIYDHTHGPALPSAYLIRFRLLQQLIKARYILQFLLSPSGQALLTGASTATAQPNVNARAIGRFPVPIAPRKEQEAILQRISQFLARYHAISDSVDASREKLSAIDSSILSKAFRGELVPQDPNDEPASVLLERIRAEAAKQEGTAKKRASKKRG